MAQDLQPSNNPGFVKKSVDTPILDESLRQKISSTGIASSSSGFKGFYQANKFYFWAILAGVIIIGTLAYFAFRPQVQLTPKEANVSINVEVPDTIASGGEAVYKITAKNNDNQKLTKVELELGYPEGMVYVSSSPGAENLSGSLFKVPDLIPGQNAVIFLKTKVTGNVNDQKTLDIKLHYSYSNFNSEFIKSASSSVTLVASNITLELTGPGATNNAQLVVYTLKYQNSSSDDIKNARVKMTYPQGFVFASASPVPDLGVDTWNIGTLAKGGAGQIEIQGNFNSANAGESKTITAEFLILAGDGNYFTQNSAQITTAISSLPLLVSQSLQSNGSNQNNIINPGDSLSFNIIYQNNAATAASGVNIEVDLNSKVIDPSSIRAEGGQINNNTIIWNASGVSQLASLLPNQQGQLSFSLKVNNPATKDSSKNLNIISSIKIQSNEYQSAFPGNQLTLKVSSPAVINTALGFVSGSLPPQVGKTTTYKVTLSLTNSGNDFGSGVVTAFIPLSPGSFISGSSGNENNNVQFDISTGKLTWNVAGLAAYTGRFSASRTLNFQLTLNPSSTQANQQVTLLKTINFSANDLFTNQQISITARDISTADLQGQSGFNNGSVQP